MNSKVMIKMQTSKQNYREIGLKRHLTVRIPRGMGGAVEGFLKTEEAASMGYDSKADVVTAAIRQLLSGYGYYKNSLKEEEVQ